MGNDTLHSHPKDIDRCGLAYSYKSANTDLNILYHNPDDSTWGY